MTDHQEEEDKKNPSKAEAGAAPAEQEAPASAYEGRQQPSSDEVQTGTRAWRVAHLEWKRRGHGSAARRRRRGEGTQRVTRDGLRTSRESGYAPINSRTATTLDRR
jgi:hypothetical protein